MSLGSIHPSSLGVECPLRLVVARREAWEKWQAAQWMGAMWSSFRTMALETPIRRSEEECDTKPLLEVRLRGPFGPQGHS